MVEKMYHLVLRLSKSMKDFELKSEQVDALYKHLKPKIDKKIQE